MTAERIVTAAPVPPDGQGTRIAFTKMGTLTNPRHERFAQALFEGETADAAYLKAASKLIVETLQD